MCACNSAIFRGGWLLTIFKKDFTARCIYIDAYRIYIHIFYPRLRMVAYYIQRFISAI